MDKISYISLSFNLKHLSAMFFFHLNEMKKKLSNCIEQFDTNFAFVQNVMSNEA